MANIDRIDSLADISALEAERDRILSILKSYSDSLQDVAKRAGKIEIYIKDSKQFSELTRATQELANATQQRKQTVEALTAAETKLKNAEQQLSSATNKQAQAEIKTQKAEQERLKTLQQKEKLEQQQLRTKAASERAAAREARDAERATNAYLQLRKEYDQLALKAKTYAVTLGEQHPTTLQAVNDAKELSDKLLRVEQAVGQNQRQVGNYKAAFDGLSVSISQVSRELPSLTVSPQQFFLAISNNLPMVADEIKRAKNELSALKAEGKDAPSLFSRIAGSLFSWQVALSVGITLLVAYGKEIGNFLSGLFKTQEAFNKSAETQKILSETLKETGNAYGDAVKLVDELTIKVDLAKKGFIDKRAVLKQYNDTIGKTTGEVKTLDEAEQQLVKNGPAYIQMMFLKAAAQLALDKAAKLALDREQKVTDIQSKSFGLVQQGQEAFIQNNAEFRAANDKAIEELKKYGRVSDETDKKVDEIRKRLSKAYFLPDEQKQIQQFKDIAKELLQQAGELSKDFNFNPFGSDGSGSASGADSQVRAFFSDALKDQAEGLKELSKQDDIYLDTRIKAREQAAAIEQTILNRNRDVDVANAKGNKDDLLAIDEKYAYEKQKIATDLNSDLFKIQLSYYAKNKDIDKEINDLFIKDQKDASDKQIEVITAEFEKRKNILDKERDDELRRLDEKYNNSKINEENYQKERTRIQNEYLALQLKAELKYTQDVINLAKARGEDVSKQEAQIANIRLRLSELNRTAIKGEADDVSKLKDKYIELGFAIADTFKTVVSGSFDRQKNAIQDQIDALDKQKEKDIEVANATIANAQDRADTIAVINARAQAKKEQLELKQRQLDIQRAKFEKQFSIARIIAETAIQVIKAGGLFTPLGAQIAAFGALSLANVIATPIPRFKHGRKGGEATLGIVGDGGVAEVLSSPDGKKAFVTPDTDTLVNIPQGWSVHKSVDDYRKSMGMRVSKDLPPLPVSRSDNSVVFALQREMKQLRSVIAGKKETHFSWDNGQLRKAIKNGYNWTKYIQDNI